MPKYEQKKIVQDIVPTGRRTIRNISIHEEISDREESEEKPTKIPIHIQPRKSSKGRFFGTFIAFVVVFVCIAIIAVALSLFFSKAVVTITPKIANIEINGVFTAKKDAKLPDLRYEIVTTTLTEHDTVPFSLGPLIQTKAKGTVYLYNEQSISQRIVAGTRLSNTKNLIYRTTSTITIPAGKVVSGKTVPGSVSVSILADKAGEAYNSSLSDLTGDFKLVAYKGGDKYDVVYGKLKSDLIGGFSGNKNTVSPEIQKTTTENLEKTLGEKLKSQLKLSVPKDYTMFDTSPIITYEISEPVQKTADTADLVVTGTAYGIIFNSETLLKSIGQKELEKFPPPTYKINGLDNLSFAIVNTKDFSPKKGNSLIFNLKGKISLIGTFSENSLKNELKGINLSQSNAVFVRYSAISNAYALITPFWMRSFPKEIEKIILETKSE